AWRKQPRLPCAAPLQRIRRFGFDASFLSSDILVPGGSMGCPVVLPAPPGPMLPQPVRVPADIERLRVPDPAAEMPFVLEALRRVRAALAPATALIGFAGAPVTLASYMVEGGSSKNFTLLKGLLHGA